MADPRLLCTRATRASRRVLFERLASAWRGTRASLRRTIREFLKPYRRKLGFLLKLARDARFAALVAAAFLGGGSSALALPPIELSTIATGNGGFFLNGAADLDRSGFSVSSAGDVNGDGAADFIIGSPNATVGANVLTGNCYVVFSTGSTGFVITGNDAGGRAGYSVSGAGDVNGDGLADLIIGAPRATAGGDAQAGRSYVVFGKAEGAAVDLSAVAAGTGGFVINGIDVQDRSGTSVSGAGDVNGDGLADLIVGAYYASGGGTARGESYVVFGKAGGAPVNLEIVAGGGGGFVINGAANFDYSGLSVSGAGDVDGDGLADLIVGAPGANGAAGANTGKSYVVFGKAGGNPVALSDVALGSGGFVINGSYAEDRSGRSVSGAGDVNGDGLADVIIGAFNAAASGDLGAGISYVVFGKATGTAVNLEQLAISGAGFAITGIDGSDASGTSVSSAGDIDGDGLADLIVGAPSADPATRSGAGESYVIFGKADPSTVDLANVAVGVGGFVLNGVANGDYSGSSVSGAGDVNGDGLDDLIIGAPSAPSGTDTHGQSFIVFSPAAAVASGTYKRTTRLGDGTGGMVAPITDFGDVARVKINFSDDDFGFGGGNFNASRETVTITRSPAGISGLSVPINLLWQISTDRNGFDSAELTFKYLDSEIASIPGRGLFVSIFTASSPSGPWTELTTTHIPERNELKTTVTAFAAPSYFALAPPNLSSLPEQNLAFVINGNAAFDYSSISVSDAGDVNGDGLADLIVGTYTDGDAYVVFGKPNSIPVELSAIAGGIGGFLIDGVEDALHPNNLRVSSAGDVNGDGLADLIVGRTTENQYAGRSTVIFGKADTSTINLSAVQAGMGGGFTINGIVVFDLSGRSVASAGDVNGDGLADLIVGASRANPGSPVVRQDAGESYVIFGKTDFVPVDLSNVKAGTGGFVIMGISQADDSGTSVSSAGDVNGDGLADLIVGAPGAGPNALTHAGESYVIFGRYIGSPVELSDVKAGYGGFAILGGVAESYSGTSVSTAGDVNGDGLSDLIISAQDASPGGRTNAGETYVIFGKTDGTAVQLSSVTANSEGFVIKGIAPNDFSGFSVSSAGDINGDGLADLLTSTPFAPPAGESYVILGKTNSSPVELSLIAVGFGGFAIFGDNAGDKSGTSVSSAGDVNGDGLSDFIVGAPYASPGGRQFAGKCYVIFSPLPAAPTGTYRMRTLAGDGQGGFVAPVTDFGDVARVKIDFSDDDLGSGFLTPSAERVIITRSGASVANLPGHANVLWRINSDRFDFNSAEITVKYLESEVQTLGDRYGLSIAIAQSPAGPWTILPTTRRPDRHELKTSITSFTASFFTIVGPPNSAKLWKWYE